MACLYGCRSKNAFVSLQDGEMTLQGIRASKNDKLFKIRLLYGKQEKGMDQQKFAENMQYHIDSCFYFLKEGKHIYPLYVTPIANGIDKSFEYMIGFDPSVATKEADTLIYFDQNRSKKSYELIFK